MYKVYIVEEGDTLDSIANKFKTTKEILNTINGNIVYLESGMSIIVPNTTDIPFDVYKVKKGDSIYSIARDYGVDYKDLLSINGLKEGEYIYPEQEILIPKRNIGIYNVTNVDTLNEIANKLNVDMNDLINQNASIYLLPNQIILYKKEKTI